MSKLSDRILSLAESETLAMSRRSREMKSNGCDIINLSIGQPDFFTPNFIKDAGKKAIDDNITYYPPVAGFLSLREMICKKLLRDNGLKYTPDQIVVSNGAKQSIANAVMSLVNPGDEVLLPIPFWVSYREIIRLAGGKHVYVPTSINNEFKVTAGELQKYITKKTRLIIFSSPSNPTGSVYTKEELRSLAELFKANPQIHIISDEIYELINFGAKHESIAQFDNIRDRVIIINGVSKGFSMTGWRLGYLAAHRDIASATEKYQGQMTSGACSVSQMAAQEALNPEPKKIEETNEMLKAFEKRRDLLISELRKIDGIKTYQPKGAFYIFPDVSALYGKSYNGKIIDNSEKLSDYLLEEAWVATVPGAAFGDPDCIRLSYATSMEQLTEAMKRINKAVDKLS